MGHLIGYSKRRNNLKTDCIVIRWKRRDELATVISWSAASRKVESRRFLHVFFRTFLVFDLYRRVKIESAFLKFIKFLAVCFECWTYVFETWAAGPRTCSSMRDSGRCVGGTGPM